MNTDELLRVIEKGLQDVRADILKQRHPDKPVRKSLSLEERLDDLEWSMSSVQSELSLIKSTVHVLEMNVERLKSITTSAEMQAKPVSKSRPRR